MSTGIQIWRTAVWEQFGAAMKMLENAIVACPETLWGDRTRKPEFWYVAFHTLFYLDFYLSGTPEGFQPPAPFTRDELDPSGIMPDRVYAKAELLEYLRHCREKCRKTIDVLTDLEAAKSCNFEWLKATIGELLLYNMRHVEHHVGQLNLILRQNDAAVPRWVSRATPRPKDTNV